MLIYSVSAKRLLLNLDLDGRLIVIAVGDGRLIIVVLLLLVRQSFLVFWSLNPCRIQYWPCNNETVTYYKYKHYTDIYKYLRFVFGQQIKTKLKTSASIFKSILLKCATYKTNVSVIHCHHHQ